MMHAERQIDNYWQGDREGDRKLRRQRDWEVGREREEKGVQGGREKGLRDTTVVRQWVRGDTWGRKDREKDRHVHRKIVKK
jgi:hypothetical protein